MVSPKISIIVPVYNAEKYLHRCIDSILTQTFSDFELLLIDDGSTDNSGAICDEYAKTDSRIKVFHKENGGVSSARNLGLAKAHGEWIAFVDADDKLDSKMYELLFDKAIYTNADIVVCDFYLDYGNTLKVVKSMPDSICKTDFIRFYIVSWSVVWNMLTRKKIYEEYNIVFPDKMAYSEDFFVGIKLLYHAGIVAYVDVPLYYYNRVNYSAATKNIGANSYQMILKSEAGIVEFLTEKGVIALYEREMSWRILHTKQDLVFYPKKYNEFLSIYPPSHRFIMSCPLINRKVKFMMWLIVHHMRWVAAFFNMVRKCIIANRK